jgi:hypothetical protein
MKNSGLAACTSKSFTPCATKSCPNTRYWFIIRATRTFVPTPSMLATSTGCR